MVLKIMFTFLLKQSKTECVCCFVDVYIWLPSCYKSDVARSRGIAGDKTGLNILENNNIAHWTKQRHNPKTAIYSW